MDWIYLSPHLDDVALSVGGLLWEQSEAGEAVAILTICAGDPPSGDFSAFAESLHARWGIGAQSMPTRRAEDIASCQRLGAAYVHFGIPDCIYRHSLITGEYLYASEDALWIPLHPHEEVLVAEIVSLLKQHLTPQAQVVCPLGLGNHVDHQLTRTAAEKLGVPLWYYADYPYVLQAENFSRLENLRSTVTPLLPAGLLAWQDAIAAHRSQISTFWQNLDEMRTEIQKYHSQMEGVRLFANS